MLAPEWNELNPSLLDRIRKRLEGNFGEFADTCQSVGLLQRNFTELSDSIAKGTAKMDQSFACSMCASAVVSAANHYGGQGDLELAEKLAGWALQLEPSHVPALLCLKAIALGRGDQRAMDDHQATADRILKRIRSTPEARLTAFEIGLLKGA